MAVVLAGEQTRFELDETVPPRPGDDGTVGLMVMRTRGTAAYVTTDEDGRVLQMAGPPLDDEGNALDVYLAGHGRRVLALPSYTGNDGTVSPLARCARIRLMNSSTTLTLDCSV